MSHPPDPREPAGSNGPLYWIIACLTVFFCVAAAGHQEWHGTAAAAFVERFQTIIAGGVALFAALLTVYMLARQIRLQQAQIDEEKWRYADTRRSKAWAAKAALPDALSELCLYTEDCVNYLVNGNKDTGLPDRPTGAIDVIKSAVEFADPESAKSLFNVVTHYQIHNARLGRYDETTGDHTSPTEVNDRVYDSIFLRALVDGLFEFARNEIETAPSTEITRQKMLSALRQCIGVAKYYATEKKYEPVIDLINNKIPDV